MSVYRRARRFVLAMMAVFFTIPFWNNLLPSSGGLLFPLMGSLWVAAWVMASLTFRCCECQTSVFRTKPNWLRFATPWPHRRCCECGHDLTAA